MQCPACQTPVDPSQRFCPSCGTAIAAGEAPVVDPLLSQTLGGKYKVIRPLGEGGMGAVYEGEQQLGTTKRKVAIKTLHPHLSRDPKIKARFEREVGTIAELEHPNTIQVYDFGSTPDGILYIVMEFLLGKSLADVLAKGGPMAPARVARIMRQVCGSLEEAHARGIVHRDLKPDNIVLVERAGQKDFVKVLDFGIAKRANEEDRNEQKLTQQGMVLGTPPYMSPEQFSGRPIDSRSDIYSLGVVAYEMLTGVLPFKADTAWEWATQHMTQPPIPIEASGAGAAAPAAMREAIKRALAKAPEARFPNVKEFVDAFLDEGPAVVLGGGPTNEPLARQKTEMAVPLDLASAFGPAPSAVRAGASGGGPTPAAANVSFPTPAGIPQPPPGGGRGEAGASGRKKLLAAAALIALASIGAIVFAMRGGSTKTEPTVFVGGAETSSAPPVALSAAPENGAPVEAHAPADVPPLQTAGRTAPSPHVPPHPAASSASAPAAAPKTSGPAPLPVPPPVAFPNPVALPTQPPAPAPAAAPPRYDGAECQTARKLKALGHPREAESWALACIAKGGTP